MNQNFNTTQTVSAPTTSEGAYIYIRPGHLWLGGGMLFVIVILAILAMARAIDESRRRQEYLDGKLRQHSRLDDIEDELVEGTQSPKYEPSPWLPEALNDQIDARVRAQAARLYLQGMQVAEHQHRQTGEMAGNQAATPPETPGNFRETSGGNIPKNYRILADGEAEPINELSTKFRCIALLREGENRIKTLTKECFGVDGGRDYSALSKWIKKWIQEWETNKDD